MQDATTITILAYRSKQTIERCIRSALAQSYRGSVEVRVREQAGNDTEWNLIAEIAKNVTPAPNRAVHIERGENLGFAAGHNKLIRESQGDFVLCLNADAVLLPQFIEEALSAFDDPSVGAVQGKLLRWNIENNDVRRGPNGRPMIDTTGLVPLRNRRIINRGQSEEDTGQYDNDTEVWGPDGATPLYRRSALDDAAIPILRGRTSAGGPTLEYLDEDFFTYKEDVDLAWRLRWRGWKTMYVPGAVAWHGRGSGDSAAHAPLRIIAERRKLSPTAKYYAFSNQRLMQIKNETAEGLARGFFPFLMKECGAWGFALLTERKTIPAAWRMIRLMPSAWRKRRWIMRHRKPGANPYRWFRY